MVAHMNEAALRATLATGVVHYWSRSRGALWRKGDTSGQTQTLVEMRVDCDQDAFLAFVKVGGDGGACHTGRRSCFYRRVETDGETARLAFIEPQSAEAAELASARTAGGLRRSEQIHVNSLATSGAQA